MSEFVFTFKKEKWFLFLWSDFGRLPSSMQFGLKPETLNTVTHLLTSASSAFIAFLTGVHSNENNVLSEPQLLFARESWKYVYV